MTLRSEKPQKLSKMIVQVVGEAEEIDEPDSAGMTAMYLAVVRQLHDVVEEIAPPNHYAWALEQFLQFANSSTASTCPPCTA